MGFQEEGASSKDSSFDALFSDDDTKGDQAVASKPSSSHVIGASTSSALLVWKCRLQSRGTNVLEIIFRFIR